MYPIVAVYEADPLAVAVGKGPVDAGIPGRREAAIFLMNHMNPLIFRDILVADGRTVVRAAIVYEDQLEVRKRLRKDTVNAAADI